MDCVIGHEVDLGQQISLIKGNPMKRADHDAHSTASVSAQEPTGYQKASTASGTKSKGQSDTDLKDFQNEVLCLIAQNYLNTPPQNRDERDECKEYFNPLTPTCNTCLPKS